jgi:hypothetical protein
MTGSSQPEMAQQITNAMNNLREAAAGSLDPCINAIYIAMQDPRVRELVEAKLQNRDYTFQGVSCLHEQATAPTQYVLFDFVCKPDVFCLVKPWFLVGVDVRHRHVLFIENPYTPATECRSDTLVSCSPFTLACLYWRFWLSTRIALWDTLCSPRLLEHGGSPAPRRLYKPMQVIGRQ